MFYGISKNKNGKEITDFEKYTPWEGENYSGKLKYQLDNQNQYEIYREFRKKEPKIFNQNLEEISAQFNIDKTKGNQFFYEQTKIEEELFLSTIVSEQEKLKLDEKDQTTLVQKLSNIASTGEYNISFQKIINKLNKKQLEEIGTKRSQDRPINIIENKINKLQQEKEILEEYQTKKYEIEETKKQIQEEIKQQEEKLEVLQNIKQIQNKIKLEQEKININQREVENCNKNIEELEKQIEQLQIEPIRQAKGRRAKKLKIENKIHIYIITIGIILSAIALALIKHEIIKLIPTVFTIVYGIVICYTQINKKMCINKISKEKEAEIEQIKLQIEIIQKNKKQHEQQISVVENAIINYIEIQMQILKNKIINIELKQQVNQLLENENIENKIAITQNILNEARLKIHRLDLENQNIILKLENIAEIEEKISNLKEQYQELLEYNESVELAKQEIEKAYEEIKQNITPKFTKQLSETIEQISNRKYKKVKFNDEKGIIVELENGNYVSANRLSIGTIDQLYLALRLSTIQEITEEKMPIILDEAFAYFDEERLENILKYLSQNFSNRQIIIFTCTNREKHILEKNNVQYNLISLSK